jgi:hypothetical protein
MKIPRFGVLLAIHPDRSRCQATARPGLGGDYRFSHESSRNGAARCRETMLTVQSDWSNFFSDVKKNNNRTFARLV